MTYLRRFLLIFLGAIIVSSIVASASDTGDWSVLVEDSNPKACWAVTATLEGTETWLLYVTRYSGKRNADVYIKFEGKPARTSDLVLMVGREVYALHVKVEGGTFHAWLKDFPATDTVVAKMVSAEAMGRKAVYIVSRAKPGIAMASFSTHGLGKAIQIAQAHCR